MSIAIKKSNKLFKVAKIISLKKVILFFVMFLFFNVFYKEALSEERGQNIHSFFKNVPLSLLLSEAGSVSTSEGKKSTSPDKKYGKLLKHLKAKNSQSKVKRKTASTDANKKTAKVKRRPANAPFSCSDDEDYVNEYTQGSVILKYRVCEPMPDKKLTCIVDLHVERNSCDGDDLVRNYCDSEKENLFSYEFIKCPKGCSERRCIK